MGMCLQGQRCRPSRQPHPSWHVLFLCCTKLPVKEGLATTYTWASGSNNWKTMARARVTAPESISVVEKDRWQVSIGSSQCQVE